MTLFKKAMIGISGALCFVFFVLYEISRSVSASAQDIDIVYPSGNLSDNLFVSQNSEYVPNDYLPEQYSFEDIPYMVDLPSGNSAQVGSGHIVQGGEDLVFYVSQIASDVDIHSAVLSQYPPVVYMNYSQNDSYSMTLKEESGYLNGLPGTYFVDHLLVSTGKSSEARNAYVIGYCFEPVCDVPYKFIISVATTQQSTENFEQCKQLLDVVAYTVRYDEKLDRSQKDTRAQLARANEQAYAAEQRAYEQAQKQKERELAKQQKEDKSLNTSGLDSLSSSDSGSLSTGSMSIPISVTQDFINLSILVTWTNSCDDVDILFTSSDDSRNIKPDLISSKQATINVGSCKSGNYSLEVSNYNQLGTFNTKLIENGH